MRASGNEWDDNGEFGGIKFKAGENERKPSKSKNLPPTPIRPPQIPQGMTEMWSRHTSGWGRVVEPLSQVAGNQLLVAQNLLEFLHAFYWNLLPVGLLISALLPLSAFINGYKVMIIEMCLRFKNNHRQIIIKLENSLKSYRLISVIVSFLYESLY